MMTDTQLCSDTQLVNRCLWGDRDAFGKIVERYQGLICAIAYSICGDINRSEDVAQETFLAAWRNLDSLKERDHLKQWLCGIVRHIIQESQRRATRDPISRSAPLDEGVADGGDELEPSEQMISKEEQAILWRVLEGLPAVYREPLILFYRQEQSLAEVAGALDLSEDAVKQRLSRGRAMLSERMAKFVETALHGSRPGKVFTLGVLAALPLVATSAKAVTAGAAAAKGTGAAKSGFLAAWLAPFIGIFGGLTAAWLSVRIAPTEAERRVKKASFIVLWVFVFTWCFIAQPLVKALGESCHWAAATKYAVMAGFWWFYAAVAAAIMVVAFRQIITIRRQFEAAGGVSQPSGASPTWRTRLALVACLHLAFSWVVYLAWDTGDRAWAAWSAAALVLMAAWYVYRLRGMAGSVSASIRVTATHIAVLCGAALVVLNLRMDVWLAERREVSLDEIHQLLPIWVMPLLTIGLVAWVAILWMMTMPRTKSTSHR